MSKITSVGDNHKQELHSQWMRAIKQLPQDVLLLELERMTTLLLDNTIDYSPEIDESLRQEFLFLLNSKKGECEPSP